MSEVPISRAFYLAVAAIAGTNGTTPLPKGLNQASVGDWKLAVNNGKVPVALNGDQMLDPYTVLAENTRYFAFAIFGPDGGAIGGMPEDQFIADLKAAGFGEPGDG